MPCLTTKKAQPAKSFLITILRSAGRTTKSADVVLCLLFAFVGLHLLVVERLVYAVFGQ